jgi:hypothetical protein
MRISEVITESKLLSELSRPTPKGAEQKLFAAGYEKIGKGTWGEVYSKPDDPYVLKLFHPGDKAYRAFMNLAMQHQDNPHFPKFKGKMVRVTDDYSAVRMERLEPMRDRKITQALSGYIEELAGEEYAYASKRVIWPLRFKNPRLKEACNLIATLIGDRFGLDLEGTGNIMRRENTLVFIDPISG